MEEHIEPDIEVEAEDETKKRTLVITGRAKDISGFVNLVEDLLFDNFSIFTVDPLEDEEGADGKVRWIAMASGYEIGELTADNQTTRLRNTGGDLWCRSYLTLEEAGAEAETEYGYFTRHKELEKREEVAKERDEKFTGFTAEEIQSLKLFSLLHAHGQILPIRALYEDRPVVLLTWPVTNFDETEITITPYAILCTDAIMGDKLELPTNGRED